MQVARTGAFRKKKEAAGLGSLGIAMKKRAGANAIRLPGEIGTRRSRERVQLGSCLHRSRNRVAQATLTIG
ncbi:MAG TPA: hypothetical protein VLW55_28300 [Burkholderiaceae bacterium]|nr:hypothetical protein [Burkholderiaceae bacterium]